MKLAEKFNHDFDHDFFELFDSKGNQIYYEYSNGFWGKSKYDSNGNQTYYENSRGFWYKKEYDSKGNKIYWEDSNRIYWENSNGCKEDKRPTSPCNGKIVEIDGKKYELKEV